MLKGLYKIELETPRRRAVGVVFASNGEIRGGSSAFAYVGSYNQVGHKISGVVVARQHTHNPDLPPLFDLSEVRIDFCGVEKNDLASLDCTAAEAPSVGLKALLTRLCD